MVSTLRTCECVGHLSKNMDSFKSSTLPHACYDFSCLLCFAHSDATQRGNFPDHYVFADAPFADSRRKANRYIPLVSVCIPTLHLLTPALWKRRHAGGCNGLERFVSVLKRMSSSSRSVR